MNRKTIILVVIIIVVILLGAVVGIYFGFFKKPSLQTDIEKIKIPEIKTSFESGISDLELNTFDIGASLPSELFPNISVDTNLGGLGGGVEIGAPSVSGEMPSWQGGGAGGPAINEATCNSFKAAPSCSFVPSQYRGLCQQCKQAGF